MIKELPNDPFILLSYINTKLRDNYRSLAELCDDLHVQERDIINKLATIGYVYNTDLNKFV